MRVFVKKIGVCIGVVVFSILLLEGGLRLTGASDLFWRTLKGMIKEVLPKRPAIVLKQPLSKDATNILFLHHSTGKAVWDGGVESWFKSARQITGKQYFIIEQEFPKTPGNYPYDYWNIWVKHQGNEPYQNDPTLEMITQKYDMIIWKHCFPVGDIGQDINNPDINSVNKRIENYKLQYQALKAKMREFKNTNFIVWTGAAQVKGKTTQDNAKRARVFFDWVRKEWDQPGDNIFLWDFYDLQTEGGLYFKDMYARGPKDSHPNEAFSRRASRLFCERILDVLEGRGDESTLTGNVTPLQEREGTKTLQSNPELLIRK